MTAFCLKLVYVKGSEATKSYINLHCGSHNLSYNITEQNQCMLLPDIGYSICTLDGYDVVGNLVINQNDPAVHLVNIIVFGGSTSTTFTDPSNKISGGSTSTSFTDPSNKICYWYVAILLFI